LAGEPVRALLLFAVIDGNGGIQRFNRMLIAAVEKLDVRCDVFSLYGTAHPVSPCAAKSDVKIRVFNGSKIRYALAVARVICFGHYRHVVVGHINLLVMLAAALTLRPLGAPRTWLVAHGVEVWSGIGTLRRIAIRRLWGILSVSRYTQQRIHEQVPQLLPERLVLFPLAVSESWTAASARCDGFEVSSGLPGGFLLSVTRLDSCERDKGILTVLEALGRIEDRGMQYLIVGGGDDQVFLQDAARRFGVTDRVRFLGAVVDRDLAELYRRCVAFILPSGKEGFGLVFLEAMLFGAAVIAAREKGALDVVRDEETGLLVDFGDVIGVIRAINRMTADVDLRERLRTRARKMVVGDGVFTFGAFVSRLAAVLDAPIRAGITVNGGSGAGHADSNTG
jgi:phosphatidylinositol alpha-1,6-mannosyltransferase